MPTRVVTKSRACSRALREGWHGVLDRAKRITPESGDALLYLSGALFALLTVATSTNALYQRLGSHGRAALPARCGRWPVWWRCGPDAPGAVGRTGRRTRPCARRAWVARVAVAACVFVGALVVPMSFEILWRFDGVAGSHQQPEVVTVEVGGQDIVHGVDPYHPLVRLPHAVKYHAPGQPDFAGFLPYLPLMAVAGIPSDIWPNSDLSDAADLLLLEHAGRGGVGAVLVPVRAAAEDARLPGADHPAPGLVAAGHRW